MVFRSGQLPRIRRDFGSLEVLGEDGVVCMRQRKRPHSADRAGGTFGMIAPEQNGFVNFTGLSRILGDIEEKVVILRKGLEHLARTISGGRTAWG